MYVTYFQYVFQNNSRPSLGESVEREAHEIDTKKQFKKNFRKARLQKEFLKNLNRLGRSKKKMKTDR